MKVEEVVGRRIREARELRGMSQPELGEYLAPLLGKPLPRQAVYAAEQGRRQFTAAELVAFAYVLGVSVQDLFRLPLDLDGFEMPSGSALTREDLRQANAGGRDSREQELAAVLMVAARRAEDLAGQLMTVSTMAGQVHALLDTRAAEEAQA